MSGRVKLHLNQVSKWKQEFLSSAELVFEKGQSKQETKSNKEEEEKLYQIIGKQKVEIDFLKHALS